MRVLVTGSAGFVGFSLARRLLAAGHNVCGIDGMTPYYDVALKERRHDILRRHNSFTAHRLMLEDGEAFDKVAAAAEPEMVIHLAAQAGVRYSLDHPRAYIDSNVIGSFNVIEFCRRHPVKHLLIASTSSVYGANSIMPFAETDNTDTPLTIYSASKKAAEAMAHGYAHLWNIPTTVFRLFTVYGPWGRPDMALFKFVRAMLAGEPIEIYNHGKMERDFTYIDDAALSIERLMDKIPMIGQRVGEMDSLSPVAPFRVVNVGGGAPVRLLDFVGAIEASLGIAARRHYVDMQAGDVPNTRASSALLEALIGFRPATPIAQGIADFVGWYREYHKI
jgi:UDP-glucuronate 4-epimerase